MCEFSALEKLDLNGESSDKVEPQMIENEDDHSIENNEVEEENHSQNDETFTQSEVDENDGVVGDENNFDDNRSYVTDDNISQFMEQANEHPMIMQKYNKRQTGKRNISNIVVGTDSNMEFDQIEDKGFGVVKINRPYGMPSKTQSVYSGDDNESRVSETNPMTADGFFDLKFYSHPLW